MTMTNLAPTSRWAIRPSGETRDLVRPGISSVVARIFAVVDAPEFGPRAFLQGISMSLEGFPLRNNLHLWTTWSCGNGGIGEGHAHAIGMRKEVAASMTHIRLTMRSSSKRFWWWHGLRDCFVDQVMLNHGFIGKFRIWRAVGAAHHGGDGHVGMLALAARRENPAPAELDVANTPSSRGIRCHLGLYLYRRSQRCPLLFLARCKPRGAK